jgi:translocation and assembly module TamB
MVRWLHLCWSLPLLLAVLALGAVDYLAYTPAGLAVVARSLNRQIGPVRIEIHGARGTLAHGLHVDRLIIDHRRVHIEIEQLDGQVAILPLVWRTIQVPRVHAEQLLVHVLPHVDDGRYWDPHFLPPLTRVNAVLVQVDRWRLQMPNDDIYDTRSATTTATLFPKVIRIHASRFDYGLVHIHASGDVLAATSIGLNGALHFDAEPPDQPPWTVNAQVDGNMSRLGLDANFTEPFGAVFHGEIHDVTSHWRWHGQARVGRFDLAAWNAGHVLGILTGDLALEGDHFGFRAQGSVTAPGLNAGPLDARFRGSYHEATLNIEDVQLHHPASGTTLIAAGTAAIAHGGPRLDLRGSWSHFRWPLAVNDAPFHSEHGVFTLQQLRPYAFTTAGELRIADLEPMQLALRGRLATDGMTAESGSLQMWGARADLNGRLHWTPAADWQVRAHVNDLDVARLRPGTPGRLNFALAADGNGFTSQGRLAAAISELSGNVRGQRAQGHGQFVHGSDEWQFNDVRLQLGSTHIDLDGRAGSSLDLNFAVDASDLALLQSDAHGQLNARGHIRGNLHDPTIITTAQARNLEWRGVQLRSLDGTIEFDPQGSGRADSSLKLQGLTWSDRRLDHLTLASQGTTASHTLSLEANAEGYALSMRGNGHYAASSWQGEIQAAQFGDGGRLNMQLESPAPVLLDGNRARLEPLCLHDGPTRLCLNGHLEDATRAVELLAENMPMRALTAGLSIATDYDGRLSVAANATATGAEPWRGSIKAKLEDASIHKHFQNGRVETLDLGNGTVTALIRAHDLTAELALDADTAGRIQGKFDAHGDSDDWHQWPLNGELTLETAALGYVSAYVGEIDRASGRISARLNVSGTAISPRLDGELKLINANLDAYQINLSLRQVNLTARLTDDRLSVEGAALVGPDGHASVRGDLRWQNGLPFGDLHLIGEDLRIVSVPEARVDASPDVTMHLDGRRIDVRGRVVLPYARIEPANLANAVLASSDEVMVGEATPKPEDQFRVFSDLTLTLGERVTVNTHGLSGRLSGNLHVSTDDTGISHGSGELNVEEGKYLAYGRNLDVQHGRLLFSNGLLSDPGMDLRAVKKFPDITAGINVRGTLRSPRMTFFSDPEVSQSQIVSLLLAGGSLESVQNASTSDTAERGNAGRSDAIMQGGAILAQQLGGRYNIEAGVEQDMTNETSLVLGRYLSPRLYVSYGVGLAEAINTIKMRYTIGDHWTVKTEAGTQRSADLVFTIEK